MDGGKEESVGGFTKDVKTTDDGGVFVKGRINSLVGTAYRVHEEYDYVR
jgi:hypothetical protein